MPRVVEGLAARSDRVAASDTLACMRYGARCGAGRSRVLPRLGEEALTPASVP